MPVFCNLTNEVWRGAGQDPCHETGEPALIEVLLRELIEPGMALPQGLFAARSVLGAECTSAVIYDILEINREMEWQSGVRSPIPRSPWVRLVATGQMQKAPARVGIPTL